MGASDSKLVFKQGIFRLSEQQSIAADDPYWTGVSSNRVGALLFTNCASVLGTTRVC